MPMTNGATHFETVLCSRCGGSGWHSYCDLWGRTCFKCGVRPHEQGHGRYLTKRGAVAHAFYVASLPTKRAADVVAGDYIRDYGKWLYVRAVTDNAVERATGHCVDGVVVYSGMNITVGGKQNRVTLCGRPYDELLPVRPAPEEIARLRAAALAYQETLTKAGKPRKRRAA